MIAMSAIETLKKRWRILVVAVLVVAFFFPKGGGSNLCGPTCPTFGLYNYERDCLGVKIPISGIDTGYDICFGLTLGEKRCYGLPYPLDGSYALTGRYAGTLMSCDYPCDNEDFKNVCRPGTNYTILVDAGSDDPVPMVFDCDQIFSKCV